MTAIRPYPWRLVPRVSRRSLSFRRMAAAHLAGALGAEGPAALARLLGASVSLRATAVEVVAVEELDDALAGAAALVLARGSRRAVVAIDQSLAVALCARVLGAPEELAAPRPLTPAEHGVLGLLVLAWLGAGDAGVRLVGPAPAATTVSQLLGPDGVAHLEARVEVDDLRGSARVLLPEALALAAPPVPEAGLRRVAGLLVSCRVELGSTRLPAPHVAELEAGDVVVMDDLAAQVETSRAARLRCGTLSIPVTVVPSGRATVSGPPREGGPMTDMTEEQSAPTERLAALEVEVTAELGRVTLPAREVATLAPGVIVELGVPLGGPIDLRVAGRLLGRGELVDIDGEVGVRVTELA